MTQSLLHLQYSFMFHAGHLEQIPHKVGSRTFQIDAGLNNAQAKTLHQAFSSYAFTGPEPKAEGYVLYGDEGYSLRIRLWELADHQKVSSIPVELITKKIDDNTLQIIFDIAVSTNMILIDSVGKKVRYIARDPNQMELEKWNDAVRIDTIDELRTWLSEEITSRRVNVNPDA